jgi:predicted RNA-binding protein associated with RNAse of E/G family
LNHLTEVKTTLAGRVDRFECDVVERDAERVVLLYRVPRDYVLHGLPVPKDGPSLGYFWRSRPYNLYHFHDLTPRTIAYYFNVGDVTRVDDSRLEWRDLAVDVLATPDSRVSVLDEDELPPDLDLATRRYVEAARDEILRDLPRLIAEAERASAAILRRVYHSPATKPRISS